MPVQESFGEKPDVFIFSIINWDFRYQRPQHLATGLAQDRRVFYVEMDLDERGLIVRRIQKNLYVVRLPRKGIGHIASYVGTPSKPQVRKWLDYLFGFCDAVRSTSQKKVILEHPFWWQFARALPPEFELIVDCMDDIAGFSNTLPHTLELELDMLAHCDKLVVTSKYLLEKYSPLHAATLIRNGGDIEHFQRHSTPRSAPAFMPAKRAETIRVGYVGAIAEWFDVELIRKAALIDQTIEYHICGAVTDARALDLERLPNVSLHGEISYADVPAFLEQIDVACIPFQLLPIILACDPVKFYEYSSMGIPTVSTRLPELAAAGDLVLFAEHPEDFVLQVRAAYEKAKDSRLRDQLANYALQNTWKHRTADLAKLLDASPLVSVVVLSYGEATLTEQTLSSLNESGGRYSPLEVVVVDNGSSPANLARVRAACGLYSNTILIENGRNLGFARGNNVGIARCHGEFVLLLNNDVFVPPGAIEGMAAHLQRNPTIGIVGPLTNSIGNEAKVSVSYDDMDQMKQVARNITTGYRGQVTPLPVLAYFAVMFRRRDLHDKFGLLPEEYGVGMFEDDDHCASVRSAGFICALAEDCFVHHEHSATFDSELTAGTKRALFERNRMLFESRWGEAWKPHQHRAARPRSIVDEGI